MNTPEIDTCHSCELGGKMCLPEDKPRVAAHPIPVRHTLSDESRQRLDELYARHGLEPVGIHSYLKSRIAHFASLVVEHESYGQPTLADAYRVTVDELTAVLNRIERT